MSERRRNGNRFVAVGLFLLAVSAAVFYADPQNIRFPILKEPVNVPMLEAPLEPALAFSVIGIALVIVGFWRGW